MSDNRKVWVYLSDKELSMETEKSISADMQLFLQNWKAHGNPLETSGEIRNHRFIIISVNEEEFAASGCSIDKQVQFIKETEKKYGINLLNRLLVAYQDGDAVQVVPVSEIRGLLGSGAISENTQVFNTSISTGSELGEAWQIPLKESWLKKFLN